MRKKKMGGKMSYNKKEGQEIQGVRGGKGKKITSWKGMENGKRGGGLGRNQKHKSASWRKEVIKEKNKTENCVTAR